MKGKISLRGLLLSFFSMVLMLTFAACNSNSNTDTTLSGTAATGAAFVGDVEVINAQGAKSSAIINNDGTYSVTIPNKPPFMLRAVAANGDQLYSFASAGGTVNITELTNLVLHLGSQGGALPTIFSDWLNTPLAAADIQNAMQIVQANIQQMLTNNSLPTSYNFFTQPFTVGTAGIDQLMDDITVVIDLNEVLANSVQILNPTTLQSVLTTGFDITAVIDNGGSTGGEGTLPAGVSGQLVTMEYSSIAAGSPYSDAEQVLFTFSSSGTLTLTEQYTVVANTFTVRGSEYVWVDSANSLEYALSLVDGVINEVNVTGIGGSPFYGQFTPVATDAGSGSSNGGSTNTGTLTNSTLTVTGTYQLNGIGINIPQVVVNNVPAPGLNDTSELEQSVATQYGANGAVSVTVINNTSTQRTFRMQFAGTIQGFSVNYDLTYDYVAN